MLGVPRAQDEDDRPSLQKEPSYERYAPPGVQPQSNIPTYPPIPGRAAASGAAAQQTSTQPIAHDPTYPGQGGGYKPSG